MLRRQRASESLQEFHDLGKLIISELAEDIGLGTGRAGRGSLTLLCSVTGRNSSELAKARQFARLYRPKKLKWLCSLGQKKGRPLTKSHVCRLVVVANSAQRDRLARQCAREGWSVQRLDREIKKIQPKRRYGGRQPEPPASLEELLVETQRLTKRWLRWQSVAADVRSKGASTKTLPPGTRQRAVAITNVMRELQREIQREITQQERRPQKQTALAKVGKRRSKRVHRKKSV